MEKKQNQKKTSRKFCIVPYLWICRLAVKVHE